MMRWQDSDTADRFRCEARDIEAQLGQSAGLFEAFRVAVDRLAQALQRQTSTSSSSSSYAYANKHFSPDEHTNRSGGSNHHPYPYQHHPHYRVSDEESAKMLASAQGLAEDLKRI